MPPVKPPEVMHADRLDAAPAATRSPSRPAPGSVRPHASIRLEASWADSLEDLREVARGCRRPRIRL